MKKTVIIGILSALIIFLSACTPENTEREDLVFMVLEKEPIQYRFNFFLGIDEIIYLPADKVNSLQINKSVSSYIPERKSYLPQMDKLSAPVEGTIEITDANGNITRINLEPFTYGVSKISDPALIIAQQSTDIPKFTNIFFGDNAESAFKAYQTEIEKYNAVKAVYDKEMELYNQKMQKLKTEADELHEQYLKRKEQNKDTAELEARLDTLMKKELTPPLQPRKPQEQVLEVDTAYQIKMPKGEYTMLIRTEDNKIIEGSKKKLVCFTSTDEETAGYHVIPRNLWNIFYDSNSGNSVVYTDGTQDLIFRPYIQERFPSGMYNQVQDPQYINQLASWKKTDYPENIKVEVSGQGSTEIKSLSPLVPANSNKGQGFSMMSEQEAQDRELEVLSEIDTVSAVIVPVKEGSGVYSVTLFAADGTEIAGSKRDIHVVSRVDMFSLVIISICIALLPILIWFLVWMFVKIPAGSRENN